MAIISIPTSIGGISVPGSLVNGPLSSLFQNKYSTGGKLQYPRDLGSAIRNHYVLFNIKRVAPANYDSTKEYNASQIWDGITNSTAVKNAGDSISNLLQGNFTQALDKAKSSVTSIQLSNSKEFDVGTVALYMTDNMEISFDTNYTETSALEMAGEAVKAIQSVAESNITKFLLQKQGLAVNPNQQLLFESIPLRTFSLAFTFTPYTKQEADTVTQIVNTFKKNSRPVATTGAGGMLFIPPSVFYIDFRFGGSVNKNIGKVGKCVLESVGVNYTPNGFSTHKDGSPVQTQLTLGFKETTYVTANQIDVQGGNY